MELLEAFTQKSSLAATFEVHAETSVKKKQENETQWVRRRPTSAKGVRILYKSSYVLDGREILHWDLWAGKASGEVTEH